MVIGDHVCIAVFRFIHFQVGVLPGKLLPRINGLWREREGGSQERLQHSGMLQHTCVSVRKSVSPRAPLPKARCSFHVCPRSRSSQTTPKPGPQWDLPPVTCRQSNPALGQPAADEPSPPLSLPAHPFLWSYPSAEIWSYARTPQRPDCAVLDLVVLLAVELQSPEI